MNEAIFVKYSMAFTSHRIRNDVHTIKNFVSLSTAVVMLQRGNSQVDDIGKFQLPPRSEQGPDATLLLKGLCHLLEGTTAALGLSRASIPAGSFVLGT